MNISTILAKQEPLTHEELSFIAKEILPAISSIPNDLLEKLEQRLKTDIESKKSTVDKKDLEDIPSLTEIERMKNVGIEERIRKYLIAECGLEYYNRIRELFKEVRSGKMTYEEYFERANKEYDRIYSICPASIEERDFVRRPYQILPISKVTNEFVKKVIEPKIEEIVRKRFR